ncbi:TCRP [Candida jiufengensis]|uniref:TCRP n=1 Tax=Candida jiufengensis TaxID=497108 RepID=UPI0022243CFC|nr:TCRP [Candida jiufengensis]KAI5953700.1 TCRP [Candida jiufengensis]
MSYVVDSLFSNDSLHKQNSSFTSTSTDIDIDGLLSQLPYFPTNGIDPIFQFTNDELISDRFPITKYPFDGFINFHSLKICSSNAKQMSKYLQLSMGFKEVAYKGLENGSRIIASHVVSNGDIFLELVNTLETINEDQNLLKFPFSQEELETFEDFDTKFKTYLEEFKITTEDLVFDYINSKIDNLSSDPVNRLKFTQCIFETILKNENYKCTTNELKSYMINILNNSEIIYNDVMECILIQNFLKNHAEGVMDIALNVNNVEQIFYKSIRSGAGIIRPLKIISDQNGSIKTATITVPNTDIQHTLIENVNYSGPFKPGYFDPLTSVSEYDNQLNKLPKIQLTAIDHCVENYSWNQMIEQAKLYAEMFGFHKYWSVDEMDVTTGYTALRSIVMSSSNGQIKIPINEPVKSRYRGQIEEFNDFYGGPGIQHIALRTNNIIKTVKSMIERGIEFNHASENYYKNLQKRLNDCDIQLYEKFEEIKKLNILVDFDSNTFNKKTKKCNYILQIFSKPLHDRPTLFIEIIQRHHHNGFGKGTFKGLFETIEEQQKLRKTFYEVE